MAKYDLHIQTVEESELQGFKFFTRGFNRSIGVRGLNKLLNIWMKIFLTPKGSDPTNLERGTDFPALMGSNITSQQDVRDVVMLSISDCNKQLAEIQRVSPPEDDDETLRTATLLQFSTPTEDGIEVWVGISNVADEEATVLVPLLTEG
jgi:hypothetical protein